MHCKKTCGICQLDKIRPRNGKKRIKEKRNKPAHPQQFGNPLFTQCNWSDAQCRRSASSPVIQKVANCRDLCWCQSAPDPDALCKLWGRSNRNIIISD